MSLSRSEKVLSGLPGLDLLLKNIRLGDSVVWHISNIKDYSFFVNKFSKTALSNKKNVVYFRFAEHEPLIQNIESIDDITVVNLDVDEGFESFTLKVCEVINKSGPDSYYVFDCISELQSVWSADFMMRNFFMAVCPILKDMSAVAYFSVMRNKHSFSSIAIIRETAKIFINAFSSNNNIYIHPLKVWNRSSEYMFLPHILKDGASELIPLTDGFNSSIYYGLTGKYGIGYNEQSLDNWDIFFLRAEEAIGKDSFTQKYFLDKLYKILIGRDAEREELFKKNFNIRDYLDINSRLIGSGSIGGKAAGMLLSRKIIEKNRPDLASKLEAHDSFYVGSNVFYTFLISNNWWRLWLEHKTDEGYFIAARALKSQIAYGEFPELVKEKFKMMLDHFGQNPIIVRSSSLLEDGFGNAFAGKYDSVFCVNKGSIEERYEQFVRAVKEVYASSMDDSALVYRQKRGLDKSDEQMSILVQRVSGSIYEDIFMPCAAGVGYSSNSYAWDKNIDPNAGLIRIVAGLGTRAVDRTSSDYPRIASLDRPDLSPVGCGNNKTSFAQRNVDVLDFEDDALVTIPFTEAISKTPKWYQNLIIEHDRSLEKIYEERGIKKEYLLTSCDNILKNKEFVYTFKEMLHTIHTHYNYPVDIEFTTNFSSEGDFLINLVQCRPLQSKGGGAQVTKIPEIPEGNTLFKLKEGAMGGPIDANIDLVAIVDPHTYYEMPYKDKPLVSRAIEMINNYAGATNKSVALLGPGRWGTSSPELGVPVRFAQICNVSALCEVSYEGAGLMPELSFGSHFFQDLVEADIFYGAIFESTMHGGKQSFYNPDLIKEGIDMYESICQGLASLSKVVSVYDVSNLSLKLISDATSSVTVLGKF